MPAWWGRRRQSTNNNSSSKSSPKPNNDHSNNNINDSSNPVSVGRAGSGSSLRSPGPGQRSSSGFSGFDSDGYGAGSGSASTPHGGSRECHPLPLPSASPNLFDHHGGSGGGGVGFANGGSASSSGSSSISSSDDAPPPLLDHQFAQLAVSRAYDGVKLKVRTKSPGPGSRVPTTSNSPRHPQSVGGSSPLHPQFGGGSSPRHPQLVTSSSLESPGGKLEDGRSQCHPLPLPPSSPTSPSAVHSARASFAAENTNNSAPSGWKKGKLLGRGTFGHVYVGFNSEMGRLCAIKEVRLISDDQNAKESLKQLNQTLTNVSFQEIILLSKLSHPNIVRYHGSELNNETLSVFLEYVSGGSVHKLLQEYGAFKEPVIQNYTRQVLYGLAYLHARNTVHRDIKGANILVDPNGEIKLADFGMAKHITNCTSVLSFKGSPYWMAPEVVMNTNGYNLAVDIWSLGCTVLEMATSKPPWSQFEGVAAIFKIGNSKDIPEIPNHLSNAAKSFLRSCLQRDPSARPSAAELLDHPFVNDQTTARISSPCTTSELFTLTSNGSSRPRDQYARPSAAEFLDHPFLADQTTARISGPCTTSELFTLTSNGNNRPQALDIHPRRKSISSYEADNMRRPVVPVSRELWDNTRTIISLPVSPCSSPLRNTSPAYKSCFLSPPHPSYAWAGGHSSHSPNDFPVSPTIAPPNYLSDPWQDTTSYKAQTPGGSPRSRPF